MHANKIAAIAVICNLPLICIILIAACMATACSRGSQISSVQESAWWAPHRTIPVQDPILFEIGVPIDRVGQTVNIVIRYGLWHSGKAVSVRDVRNWAMQASHNHRLSYKDLQRAQGIVSALPESNLDLPKGRILFVVDHFTIPSVPRVFDREKLPPEMKQLFDLLGGIRFELAAELKFDVGKDSDDGVVSVAP